MRGFRKTGNRVVSFLMSVLMILTMIPDAGVYASVATSTDAEEMGTAQVVPVNEENTEYEKTEELDLARVTYKVYTNSSCTEEVTGTEFVLSYNGRSYVDKTGELVLYEEQEELEAGLASGDEEFKAELHEGTYYLKQGKTLYNDDKVLTDTAVAEEVKDDSVITFEVTPGKLTKVKVRVNTEEDVATDTDAVEPTTDTQVESWAAEEPTRKVSAVSSDSESGPNSIVGKTITVQVAEEKLLSDSKKMKAAVLATNIGITYGGKPLITEIFYLKSPEYTYGSTGWAVCMEHRKNTPSVTTGTIYKLNNANIRRALYYSFMGPGASAWKWNANGVKNNFNRCVLAAVLDHYYVRGGKDFDSQFGNYGVGTKASYGRDYCATIEKLAVPKSESEVAFKIGGKNGNSFSVTGSISGSVFKTSSMKITGGNVTVAQVPSGTTLYVGNTPYKAGTKNIKISSGSTIYLTAPATQSGISSIKFTGDTGYDAYYLDTGTTQKIGFLGKGYTQTTTMNVNWPSVVPFTLKKTDVAGTRNLKDAEYLLYAVVDSKQINIVRFKTDSNGDGVVTAYNNGNATVKKLCSANVGDKKIYLAQGTRYYIQETSAPDYYLVNTQKQGTISGTKTTYKYEAYFGIASGKVASNYTSITGSKLSGNASGMKYTAVDTPYTLFKLKKTDNTKSKNIANVTYLVYAYVDENAYNIAQFTTQTSGVGKITKTYSNSYGTKYNDTTLKLKSGIKYLIKELSAPENYQVNTQRATANGKYYYEAYFAPSFKTAGEINEYISISKSKFETTFAAKAKATWGMTVTYDAVDTPRVPFTLKKTNVAKTKNLKDAVYLVYAVVDKKQVNLARFKTDSNGDGVVIATNPGSSTAKKLCGAKVGDKTIYLAQGTRYYIQEISAPEYYLVNTQTEKTISGTKTTYKYEAYFGIASGKVSSNYTSIKGSELSGNASGMKYKAVDTPCTMFNLKKTDISGSKNVKDAEFRLYAYVSGKAHAVADFKTDANGVGQITKDYGSSYGSKYNGTTMRLKSGIKYCIKETAAPKDYMQNTQRSTANKSNVYEAYFTPSTTTPGEIGEYTYIKGSKFKKTYADGTHTWGLTVTYCAVNTPIKVTLQKASSNTKITSGNSNYNMAGIVYKVVYEKNGSYVLSGGMNGSLMGMFILSYDGKAYADKKTGEPVVFKSASERSSYKNGWTYQYMTGLDKSKTYYAVEVNGVFKYGNGKCTQLSGDAGKMSSTGYAYSDKPTAFTPNKATVTVNVSDSPNPVKLRLYKKTIGDKCTADDFAGAEYTVYFVGPTGIMYGKTGGQAYQDGKTPTTAYPVAKLVTQGTSAGKYAGYGKVVKKYTVNYKTSSGTISFTPSTEDGGYTLSGLTKGVYYIVETKVPDGFLAGESFFVDYTGNSSLKIPTSGKDESGNESFSVTTSKTDANLRVACSVDESETGDPLNIRIQKLNPNSSDGTVKGNASLEGAQFTVKYYAGDNKNGTVDLSNGGTASPTDTWVIEAKKRKNGDVVAYLNTAYVIKHDGALEADELGTYYIEEPGTITIEETKTPDGFYGFADGEVKTASGTLPSGTSIILLQAYEDADGQMTIYSGTVSQDGNIVVSAKAQEEYIKVYEKEKRYNLKFKKLDENGEPMANTAFLITSESSGEKHVVVTDENGEFDSSKTYSSVNANDDAYEKFLEDGTIPVYVQTGVCFTGGKKASEIKGGACFMDEYTIEELPSQYIGQDSSNKLLSTLYEQPKSVTLQVGAASTKDGAVIDFGTIGNVRKPEIKSTAHGTGSESHTVAAGSEVKVTDTVACSYLKPNTAYTIKSIAVLSDSGEVLTDADGNAVSVNKTFTTGAAESPKNYVDMTVDIDYTIDTTKLAGSDIVFCEYLVLGTDNTELTDRADADDVLASDASLTNADQTVSVTSIVTKVMVDSTGTNIAPADEAVDITDTVTMTGLTAGETYKLAGSMAVAEDKSMTEITAEKEFTADASTMDVEVKFENVDLTKYAGKSLVAYEKLYSGGTLLAEHTDISDEDQTFYIPKVSTKASDVNTKTNVSVQGATTIADTITYENLPAGNTYDVLTTFVFTDSGEEVKRDDIVYSYPSKLTPEKTDGEITIEIPFDTEDLNPDTAGLTVYEVISLNGHVVARHTDINDESQQITYPYGETTAVNAATGGHTIPEGTKVSLTDTVACHNLPKDLEYTMKGVIIDRESGEPLLVNGEQVTAEKKFTTTGEYDYDVEMDFTLDTTGLVGKELVVYEYCYLGDIPVFSHDELSDAAQTVSVAKMGTTLTSEGLHVAVLTENTHLTDEVKLTGLMEGEEFTLTGYLMDRVTGERVTVNGEDVSTVKDVKADGSGDMTIEMDFVFDGTKASIVNADGSIDDVVAYEYLTYKGETVLSHEDLTDEFQTVYIPEVGTTLAETGTGVKKIADVTETALTDTVKVSGLPTGTKAKLVANLIDKETGKEVTVNGTAITAEKTFTYGVSTATATDAADYSDGLTVEMDFPKFNAKEAGIVNTDDGTSHDVVAYEYLYIEADGEYVKVGEHADINDADQTIEFSVPTCGTSAMDGITNLHVGLARIEATFIDTVNYTNLIPGREYTISGELHINKDGEDAGILTDGGKDVTATAKFTPETADGSVQLTFTYDASQLMGETVVAFEYITYKEYDVCSHAVITDEPQTVHYPKIGTTASVSDGGKVLTTGKKNTVIDTISYTNLEAGETYTIKGKLINVSTKETVDEAETTLIPMGTGFISGTTEMKFTVDVPVSGDGSYVVYEYVYDTNGNLVGKHEDITSTEQTVSYSKKPTGSTKAEDKTSGTQTAYPGEKVTIVDHVYYKNLIVGTEYTVTGKVMLKESGKALGVKGSESTVTFTPDKKDGVVDVTFTFDASALAGQQIVIFEDCMEDGKSVFVHEDLTDDDQTISFPKARTKAESKDGGKYLNAGEKNTVVDTISYTNLESGVTYTVKGKLIDKATGKAVDTAEAKFTPKGETKFVSGTTTMKFTVDVPVSGEGQYVVYEYVYTGNGTLIAKHEDIDDADQTVTYTNKPTGSTKAEDKESGTQTAYPDEKVTIIDHVYYKNLVPGKEYTLTGTVMNKKTGKALGVSGSTSTITFTPDKANGSVDMEFTFDGSALKGEQVVIFEKCTLNGKEVFTHEDLTDDDQTISFPKAGTTATVNGGKYMTKGAQNTVVDTISYTNLENGVTYKIKAELIDKDTQEVVATSKADFTPTGDGRFSSGTTTMNLSFYVTDKGTGSKNYVVFEHIYTANGTLIADHADLDDEGQTVTVLYSPKTGDGFPFIPVAVGFGLAIAVAGFSGRKLRKKKKDNE